MKSVQYSFSTILIGVLFVLTGLVGWDVVCYPFWIVLVSSKLLFRGWNRMEDLIHSQCVLISHGWFGRCKVTTAIETQIVFCSKAIVGFGIKPDFMSSLSSSSSMSVSSPRESIATISSPSLMTYASQPVRFRYPLKFVMDKIVHLGDATIKI